MSVVTSGQGVLIWNREILAGQTDKERISRREFRATKLPCSRKKGRKT
jgi:hypothetical protein